MREEPHHKTNGTASTLFASGDGEGYADRFTNLRRRTVSVAGAASVCGPEYAKRASRYYQCCQAATFDEWAHNATGEVTYSYAGGKPCKQRGCPVCQHLKSRVLVSQLQQVTDLYQERNPEYVGVFLTLTVRNCYPEQLRKTIQTMHHAFGKLRRRAEFIGAVDAYFRSTEVTVSKWMGRTYHPHIHAILMVPKSYLRKNSPLYITHARWVEIWRECLGVDYDPRVDVRAITPEAMAARNEKEGKEGREITFRKAIKEVAKYCVKADGYQTETNGRYWTDPAVFLELSEGIRGHRFYDWGGEFKLIRDELALADVDSADIDLEGEVQDIETPRQNYTHIAKISVAWNKYACGKRGAYVPIGRLDMTTGEYFTLNEARYRGGG